jgi:hypothetical protein
METWKAVPGYEGLYEVSDLGRVKSLARYVPSRWKKPRFVAERIMRSARARYIVVRLSRDADVKNFGVHRLVCEAFHGPPQEGMQAAHIDGNPYNNTASNLYWATPAENCADRKRHGRWVHGTRVNTNKLSEADISAIISEYRTGIPRKDIAAAYGVHRSSIDQLLRGDTWKHLRSE